MGNPSALTTYVEYTPPSPSPLPWHASTKHFRPMAEHRGVWNPACLSHHSILCTCSQQIQVHSMLMFFCTLRQRQRFPADPPLSPHPLTKAEYGCRDVWKAEYLVCSWAQGHGRRCPASATTIAGRKGAGIGADVRRDALRRSHTLSEPSESFGIDSFYYSPHPSFHILHIWKCFLYFLGIPRNS